MKSFQLSDPATVELNHAIRWYEQQRPDLGAELFDAISQTIELIRTPRHWHAMRDTTSKPAAASQSFPYHIVYRIREDGIYVVARWLIRVGGRTIGRVVSDQDPHNGLRLTRGGRTRGHRIISFTTRPPSGPAAASGSRDAIATRLARNCGHTDRSYNHDPPGTEPDPALVL